MGLWIKIGSPCICEWEHISAPFNPPGGLWLCYLMFIVLSDGFYEDAQAWEPIWSPTTFSSDFTAAHFIPSAASRNHFPSS